MIWGASLLASGCGNKITRPLQAVVDCTKQHAADITALVSEFRPLLQGAAPNWSAVYARAEKAGKDIGGCALAIIVQETSSRKAMPSQADGTEAHRTLEKFRHEVAGDALFRTEHGDL